MTRQLPSGLLTFLFTDIEGSTPRWESQPDEMRRALRHHDELLDAAITSHGGMIFKHTGDGVGSVFTSPQRAAEAAVELQRLLQTDDWEGEDRLKVRIGLHVGEAEPHQDDYFGPPVNRAARIMDVANGDQITLSSAAAEWISGIDIRSEGAHQLRGIGTERIFRLVPDSLQTDNRPLRARTGLPTSGLPTPIHGLIGRDTELFALSGLLEDNVTVTIVGPGGVGKTRLAVGVGHSVHERFPDGVIMCELSPVGDDRSVADAVAESLGARAQPGLSLEDSIVHFLENRRLLLVLDNCEHVIAAVRDLVRRVLSIDGAVILATSREPIGIEGEQVYGLAPLDPGTSGVALFKERALQRDAHFAPQPSDDALIEEICAKVDAVPLAIELAAAWVRVLSLEQLLEQLDDRFRILRGGRGVGRHETLRDTIRWSCELLDEQQATMFARLSVFAGGFTLDAVGEVCADEFVSSVDVLGLVMALVEKSMVVTQRGGGEIRFKMLDTLRQFGQEQLDTSREGIEFRRRHALYFGELAGREAASLLSEREADVWDVLGREWANIRTAFDTMLDNDDTDAAAELVIAVSWFGVFSMRFEAFAWANELLNRVPDDHPRAGALFGVRAVEAYFTVHADAVPLAQRGLDLDEIDADGLCRSALAAVYLNNVHSAEDSAILTKGWVAHQHLGLPASRVWAEGFRTFHLSTHDPTPEAAEHAERLWELARKSRSATTTAIAFWAQGLAVSATDPDQAMELWDEGLDAARSLNPRHLSVHLLIGLQLHFAAAHGDLGPTLVRCRDALQLAYDQHYLAGTSHLFGVAAIVLARAGRAEIGGRLLGAMEANGHLPRPNAVRAISQALSDDFDRHVGRGSHLSINDAAGLAIEALDVAIEANPS